MKLLLGNSLWHLVWQSDAMTKFVLVFLLAASIASWSIVFYKLIVGHFKQQQLRDVVRQISHVRGFDKLVSFVNRHRNSFPGQLLTEQLSGAQQIFAHKSNPNDLSTRELALLQEQRQGIVDELVEQEEAYLPMLSITAGVAPLLGLFGTVWGLTHAFISISQKQTADIVTIAPGIAEALLTTIAGLLVAIPAFIMYHYFQVQVRSTESQLYKISDRLHFVMQQLLLDGKGHDEAKFTNEPKTSTV